MKKSSLVSSLPDVSGRTVLDSLNEDASFLVAIVPLDGGLAVDHAVVVVHFHAIPVGGKNDGLALKFVVLQKTKIKSVFLMS